MTSFIVIILFLFYFIRLSNMIIRINIQSLATGASLRDFLTLVMLNKLRCQPIILLDPVFYISSQIEWQTKQIHISWLLGKPADLDLLFLQRQGISGFSRTRVNSISETSQKNMLTKLNISDGTMLRARGKHLRH